jgi:hypothetical protein
MTALLPSYVSQGGHALPIAVFRCWPRGAIHTMPS